MNEKMKVNSYSIKRVKRDGLVVVKFLCPNCSIWGDIDQEQFFGIVSIQCDCGFHKSINLHILEKQGELNTN